MLRIANANRETDVIKIKRVEGPVATCISYPCDGDCSMLAGIRRLNEDEIALAIRENRDPVQRDESQCPQIGAHLEQWRPDPDKKTFTVSATIARAAIDSGYFEEAPESQAKLKAPIGAAVMAPLTE